MLTHLVLFLGIIYSINAVRTFTPLELKELKNATVAPQSVGNVTTTNVNVTDRLVGGNLDDINNHLYVSGMYGWDEEDYLCYGAVVNAYWVVSPAGPLFNYADPAKYADLFVFIGLDFLWGPTNNYYARSIQEIVFYTEARVGILNNIALTRICPSVPQAYWAPMAPPGTTFSEGQPTTLLNYRSTDDAFESATKPVGENCECETINNFTPSQHICLKEVLGVHGDGFNDYHAPPAEIDGNLVGFLLWNQYYAGEVVINLASFYPWLADSTPVNPYLY